MLTIKTASFEKLSQQQQAQQKKPSAWQQSGGFAGMEAAFDIGRHFRPKSNENQLNEQLGIQNRPSQFTKYKPGRNARIRGVNNNNIDEFVSRQDATMIKTLLDAGVIEVDESFKDQYPL